MHAKGPFPAPFAVGDPRPLIAPAHASAEDSAMREQPSGSVTLVFTDIEGSTRLMRELGEEAYRDVLAEHRRIVRDAFASGYEVDEEGDAFFYAFPSAGTAVTAVEQAMRGLEREPIRIRVGIHTGEPVLDPPKYVGLDVHRAARVMAAGHGGQVLLSESTRALLDDGVHVRDLGEHRLKDLSGSQRLYQLGADEFPPLKTLHQTNLPVTPTQLVGRERELEELLELLRRKDVSVVTSPVRAVAARRVSRCRRLPKPRRTTSTASGS
jgi:class 3 adenylate cyclase